MKKLIKIFVVGCLLGLTMYSCKKEKYGDLIVKMTDAPGDYLKVNVDITEVQVNYTNNGSWVNLNTNAGVYDLLTLQNNVTTVLANGTNIPAGQVNQIRLILGSNNSVMLADSTVHPLTVPSSEQTGIKINVHSTIPANNPLTVTLDFDADKSVNKEGNGSYSMKPVITVRSIN